MFERKSGYVKQILDCGFDCIALIQFVVSHPFGESSHNLALSYKTLTVGNARKLENLNFVNKAQVRI